MKVYDCIPQNTCPVCKREEWYIPGDYYYGKKEKVCFVCHPPPKDSVGVIMVKKGDSVT
jgi:hypothetical protein